MTVPPDDSEPMLVPVTDGPVPPSDLAAAILAATLDAVVVVDQTTRIIFVNAAAEALFGYSSEAILGQPLGRLMPERHREGHDRLIRASQEGRLRLRRTAGIGLLTGCRADGTEFPLEATITDVNVGGRRVFAAVCRDATPYQDADALIQERLRMRNLLAKVASHAPGALGMFRLGPDGQPSVPFAAPGVEPILGVRADVLMADPASAIALMHPEDEDRVVAGLLRSAQDVTPWHDEFRVCTADAGEKWIEGAATPEPEPDGGTIWYGYVSDITRRKRMDQALRDSEEKFRSYIEHAPIAIFVVDRHGRYVDMNPAAETLLGYSSEQLLSMSVADVQAESARDVGRDHFERLLASGTSEGEVTLRRSDGGLVEVAIHAIRLADNRYIAFCRDVTERTRMEAELRDEQSLYRAVVETTGDGFWMADRTGRILEVNDAYVQRSGYARDELVTMHISDLESRESGGDVVDHIARICRYGSDLFESEHRTKDGSVWQVEVNASYWPIAGGRVFAFIRDIQRRARSEALLRVRLRLSEVAQRSTLDDVMQTALDSAERLTGSQIGFFHFVEADQEHLLLQAWSTNTIRHMCHAEAKGEHYPISEAGVWVDCFRERRPVVHNDYASLPHKKGLPPGHAEVVRELIVPVVRAGLVTAIIGVGNKPTDYGDADIEVLEELASITSDIVARKRAETEIQRYVASNPSVIYALRLGGPEPRVSWVSENIQQLTGYTLHEALQPGWWLAHAHTVEHDQFRVTDSMRGLAHDGRQSLVFRFHHKHGYDIWLRDDRRLIRDHHGEPVEVLGSWSDVTQLMQLESQLRQSQKLEAVGQLAGGVAHDFNNLLTVITGYSEVLLTLVPPGDRIREYVADIHDAGERASALTRQLLAFSRKQVMEPRVLDVNRVLSGLEKMLRRLIGEDIVVTMIRRPGIGTVRVDPGQLEQVIVNLAVNARDAMPTGGRLTFETRDVVLDEVEAARHPGTRPGRYVCLVVGDTGCGMPPELQTRIFEPFFTTKDVGQGTGLGLATVFGIVSQSDGAIDLTSAVGVGTEFRVWLPVIRESSTHETGPTDVSDPGHGQETILLVEDDEHVRKIAGLALRMFGYEVLVADSGPAAIEMARNHHAPIHLVLTDVVMPGMNGGQLADELARLRPGLPTLFMSGYVDDVSLRNRFARDGASVLQKPFRPEELARRVREIIDGAGGEHTASP